MKQAYLEAYKIRKVEQSLLDLFGQGVVGGTIHTCVGQEFTGVALAPHLKEGDIVVSNHRCHGHYMAIYKDYEGLIAEILGKPHGINRGFGGSQHIHREGFYSSGIQGGMVPNAAGMALSNKLKGTDNISVSYIGDGTLGQGIIYETLNFISKHNVPQIIIIENNKYSQSTTQEETLSGSIEGRAKAFNIDYFSGSTNSPEQLIETVGKAVSFARKDQRPAIIEIETYRLNAHSKGDDDRNQDEVDNAHKIDSLNIYLENSKEELSEQIKDFDAYVDKLIEKAQATDDSIIIDSIKPNKQIYEETKITSDKKQTTHTKELNNAFHDVFKKNPDALFLGEDIQDPYGGAFKTTKGLTDAHPTRTFNMPISEPMIAGVSLGAATTGRLVYCEIMFGDFLALAFDQILNHASKMKSMFGKDIITPLVIRTPMGGGRGYGATHSQCIEKHFMGIPGLNVFMFHPRVDSYKFHTTLAENITEPSLVFEHKLLYSQNPFKPLPEEYEIFESTELYPYSRLKTQNEADITVVALGGMGVMLESIIEEVTDEEVYLDVFYPLNLNSQNLINNISESLKKTKKILFIEEGTPSYSLSDSILGEISKVVSSSTTFETKLIAAKPMPIAASMYLEKQILPQAKDIESAIWELFDE
jgi:2-oxoisovalerate dehydrogenase E1 component